MTAETWRPVVGYEGLYEVSDLGRVRSNSKRMRRIKDRALKPASNGAGYLHVALYKGGRGLNQRVHLLVLAAFVGPRPDGYVARHLNGVRDDNRLENLLYGTPSENMQDRVRHGNDPQAAKTHCPRLHAYAGENLFVNANGKRECRICMRERSRRYRAKRTGVAA